MQQKKRRRRPLPGPGSWSAKVKSRKDEGSLIRSKKKREDRPEVEKAKGRAGEKGNEDVDARKRRRCAENGEGGRTEFGHYQGKEIEC